MSDRYTVSAKYYDDAYASDEGLHDVEFYVDLARRSGGPVLELGCGTGRVLLPIAQNGIAIDGLDSSPAMLTELRQKLARQEAAVQQRVSIFSGDLRSFRGERKYPLVIVPFRPLQHMYTVEDQIAALKTAAFHLNQDGLLAFDVFFPRFNRASQVGEERLELEWSTKENPPKRIYRYVRTESLDKVAQNFSATYIYRTYSDGKLVEEATAPLKMSWYTYPHLHALFLLSGLESVEEYGNFQRAPLNNDANEMIFVLRRSLSAT